MDAHGDAVAFSHDDLTLAEQLGTQVGLAISNTLVKENSASEMAHSVRKMQMLRDQMQQMQETLHDGEKRSYSSPKTRTAHDGYDASFDVGIAARRHIQ